MNILSTIYYQYRRFAKAFWIFAAIAGPGLIVMIADNDAGGITTYAVTGSKFGYSFIWIELLLLPIAYVCQEMTVRLGAITKRGHAQAIFEAFGPFWGWFSLLDLTLTDVLTIVTEFIGMTAALSIFGIPTIITVVISIVLIMGITISGSYWTFEKIILAFCLLNLIYVPAAFMVHPDVSAIIQQGLIPRLPTGSANLFFFFVMANIGTTIAPWMIFFQQSAVVDKGLKEKDIKWERLDTFLGSVWTILIGIALIIITGTLLPGAPVESAAEVALKLMPINNYVGTFIAIGLFDAGFLGAVCISLASSWALGEVFGWSHSLNNRVSQAPWFFFFRFIILCLAGIIVLIPNAPLVLITLFVQVIAVTLLPAALTFLLLLLNQEEEVGKYKNTLFQNIVASIIIIAIIILSTLYGISALFPGWFA
ncbi:MAG: divalent metal cation transporter [Candidatus Bathyarchaeota archaeon]|nr:divalent metal cation transporter [Candidatus Bathyarchaeota archaeon]